MAPRYWAARIGQALWDGQHQNALPGIAVVGVNLAVMWDPKYTVATHTRRAVTILAASAANVGYGRPQPGPGISRMVIRRPHPTHRR